MTLEQKLKLMIGDMMVAVLTLQAQLDEANKKIAELTKDGTTGG